MSPQEYDSPWKELVDHDLPALLALLAPEVHGEIDWGHDVESLEQELRKLAPAGETGKRLADKLLKARTRGGDERYLLVEVQAQPQEGFERRLYTYHYRIDDRFGLPPAAVVILADDDPDWRPTRYVVEVWRLRLAFEFEPVKLLDWEGRKEELRGHPNPALFVLAHLESQRTRNDDAERARVKLDLILRLRDRKLDAEGLRQWYRYLDWLLALPEEFEDQVWKEVERVGKENQVPFVTYAERSAERRGMEKGIEQGIEKGIEQGRGEGERSGMLKVLGPLLKAKFGEEGAAFVADLERVSESEKIQAVANGLADPAAGLDDLRRLVAAESAPPGH
jgi:hypothetical protein